MCPAVSLALMADDLDFSYSAPYLTSLVLLRHFGAVRATIDECEPKVVVAAKGTGVGEDLGVKLLHGHTQHEAGDRA